MAGRPFFCKRAIQDGADQGSRESSAHRCCLSGSCASGRQTYCVVAASHGICLIMNMAIFFSTHCRQAIRMEKCRDMLHDFWRDHIKHRAADHGNHGHNCAAYVG